MTRQEIAQALRCCAGGLGHDDACENCKVGETQDRREYIEFAGANVIERLTAENADLRKEIEWKDMVIALAQRKQTEAEAERDAAIVDLKIFAGCFACRHCCNHRRDHQESLLLTCCDCTKKQNCKCGSCSLGRSNWEWHGLQGAPEEGDT